MEVAEVAALVRRVPGWERRELRSKPHVVPSKLSESVRRGEGVLRRVGRHAGDLRSPRVFEDLVEAGWRVSSNDGQIKKAVLALD